MYPHCEERVICLTAFCSLMVNKWELQRGEAVDKLNEQGE
jgi:hypothetical protein